MKTLKLTYTIKSSVESVWQALVDAHEIEGWGAGPAEMSDKEGMKFKLWGGDIHGTNIEVIPGEKLVQDWYGGDWPAPSKVTITLMQEDHDCHIELLHENIPDADFDDIKQGWDEYYFGPLKAYVEKAKDQYEETLT